MLTADGCRARRERLWDALPSSCDFLVLRSPESLVYFAGYNPSPFVFRTNEQGAVLILEPGRASLVADDMVGPFVARAHVDERVTPSWYNGDVAAPDRRGLLVQSALDRLKTIEGDRVGIDLASVPAGIVGGLRLARPDLKILDIGPVLRPMRRSKDADEVEAIKKSIRAGEAAQAAAMSSIKPGMTELDAYLICQNAAIRELGEPAILYGDFASGTRTEVEKGGSPTARIISTGELLLLDFSVVVEGYRGDFTNTFAVGGCQSSTQRELFHACMKALKAGESALKPGAPARGVYEAVNGAFAAEGLDAHFPHHAGHGIGLGHPEPPYFVPHSDETLVEGDVVAIEPGLYLEGIGGMRFERNYLITADGFETLSRHELRLD